jgi:hypothetical protein
VRAKSIMDIAFFAFDNHETGRIEEEFLFLSPCTSLFRVGSYCFTDETKLMSILIISYEIFDSIDFLLVAESSITSQLIMDEARPKINIVCLNVPFTLASFRNSKSYDNDYMCLRDLFNMTQQQICLVVSASTGKNIIPLIHNHHFVEYIYVFCESASNDDVLNWSKNYSKISGVFDSPRTIENKMDQDSRSCSTLSSFDKKRLIYAFYKQNLSDESIETFPATEEIPDDISMAYICCSDYVTEELPMVTQLNAEQRDFISFQMMIETLLNMPSLPDSNIEMMLACEQLCNDDNQLFDAITSSLKNYSPTELIQQLTSGSLPLSRIIHRLYKDFSMKRMLSLQQLLAYIREAADTLCLCASSFTAYRAQIIGIDEIVSLKNKSCTEILSLRSYALASTCIVTARTIARQAKDRGYLTAVLEIEVSHKYAKMVYSVDANRVLFQLGTVFRLCSVDLALDGVWHIHLKCVADEKHLITEQLQLQIGERLTWLTFGNYLFALQKHTEAIDYCQYLLDHLGRYSLARSSIYNNMGVMFSLKQMDMKALRYYDEALKLVGQSDPMNGSVIVDLKTGVYCSDLDQTLNSYKQALACSADSYSCNLY